MRCCSLSPIVTRWWILSSMTEVMEVTSPIEEPSKVQLAASNAWAPGIDERMALAIAVLVQTGWNSDGSSASPIRISHAAQSPGRA